MKSAVLCVVAAACGPGLSQTQERSPADETADAAASFARATQVGDVKAVRAFLGAHVMNGGLWFADATCQIAFAAPGAVEGARLDELARCLALAKVNVQTRKDSLPDVAVLSYAPGIELEARFVDTTKGPWLSWIGFVARRDVADALPTITPDTLEALRVAGHRAPQVTELANEIATSKRKAAYAWVKLCIDGDGNVTGVHVREASSRRAARALPAAIADWKFKPFVPAGQPMPVCSVLALGSPLAEVLAHAAIPFPMRDAELVVAPMTLIRVAGNKVITPDDRTKLAIQQAGLHRVSGTFRLCLDEAGRVHDLQMLRSTGVPAYDGRLLQGIAQWHYEPYLDEGEPTAVCTAVTFIYSQR